MAHACAIGHITIKHPEKWAEYRARVPATIAPWGGELIFRGNVAEVLSGEHPHSDTVVIRFPNLRALRGWHDSPEYQALLPLRRAAADVVLLACEE